jgi:predicted Rossmann fold nucleotide-binding protein DprA/Smf involved in DNA uptake
VELGLEATVRGLQPADEDALLQRLASGPCSVDELASGDPGETAQLLARLTELEIQQRVRRLPGALYVRI